MIDRDRERERERKREREKERGKLNNYGLKWRNTQRLLRDSYFICRFRNVKKNVKQSLTRSHVRQ